MASGVSAISGLLGGTLGADRQMMDLETARDAPQRIGRRLERGSSDAKRGGLLMRSVTYSMGVSLDGYIVGPDGGFNWTALDPEVFRFWIDDIRGVGVHLLGRRLYETMLYWETADQSR